MLVRSHGTSANRLRLESLESRTMMASDVTVQIIDGSLFVYGSAEADHIEVESAGSGKFRITGFDGTTVNGAASFTTGKIALDVNIFLYEGDDTVTVADCSIKRDLEIDTHGGLDRIVLNEVTVNRNTTMVTGADSDSVDIIKSKFGAKVSGNIDGRLFIDTEDGDDTVSIENSSVKRELSIKANQGRDTVTLSKVTADSLFASLAHGNNDLLTLNTVRSKLTTLLGGGDLGDTLIRTNSKLGTLTIAGFEVGGAT